MPAGGFQGQMFEEQDQYIQERSNAMAQVESTIVELGDMFTQLATMVQGLFWGDLRIVQHFMALWIF